MYTSYMSMSADINKEKYNNLFLYFVKNCNTKNLGKTKLNKLIYYADFLSYRDLGKPMTGDVYIRRDYGPVGKRANMVRGVLTRTGRINEEEIKIDSEKKQFRYTMAEFSGVDMSVFTKEEKSLLKKICKKFKGYSTDQIVAQTHLEAPWFYSGKEKEIEYEYAHSIEVLA